MPVCLGLRGSMWLLVIKQGPNPARSCFQARFQDFMPWVTGSPRRVQMCSLNLEGITLAVGSLVRNAIHRVEMEQRRSQSRCEDAGEEPVPMAWARGTLAFIGAGRKWMVSRLTEGVESKGLGGWTLGWRKGKCQRGLIAFWLMQLGGQWCPSQVGKTRGGPKLGRLREYGRVVNKQARKQQSENTFLRSPEVKRQFKSRTHRMPP